MDQEELIYCEETESQVGMSPENQIMEVLRRKQRAVSTNQYGITPWERININKSRRSSPVSVMIYYISKEYKDDELWKSLDPNVHVIYEYLSPIEFS